ncbi:MAG TPA: dihydroorotate dehydrogenase electron transfer subunit [Spirochaetaceae bacterium]|jgi:dihydroorotate dehydrogenase electron transfer subunit|nr:dihydroorotate dehydrogenase electron transfer subunit [Spirochaetaceae bacterium]
MKRFDAPVTSLRPIARDYFELRFAWKAEAGLPLPGAFLTVRAGGQYDPIVRRPFAFSCYAPDRGEAAFIFQKRGRGTAWLSGLRAGDSIDVLGPLGKGFSPPPPGSRPLLIGGGIGLGPMLYLAHQLAKEAARGSFEAPVLALGFRTEAQLPKLELPAGTVLCTDDGSAGFHGSVAEWLWSFDSSVPPALFACGPAPMMAAIDRYAAARNAPYQAATEQWMACGVGACAGCAIRLKDGSYKRVCADGPVFDGSLIAWED